MQTLYFSHGFSPVFKDLTKVDIPKDIDVILVAPKGSGRTVRTLFREGRGINSSVAVYQDVTGKAEEKAVALGVAVGSGYLYKTTFEKEVFSDLYGERGCLMGGIHGMFLAQYEVLRERGHSPSEAFNETVEEATQSLYPLIGANGMDWMYAACSTTARRGAIDWSGKFKDTLKPVFNELYDSVKDGKETKRVSDDTSFGYHLGLTCNRSRWTTTRSLTTVRSMKRRCRRFVTWRSGGLGRLFGELIGRDCRRASY